jgi:hypothetical protein
MYPSGRCFLGNVILLLLGITEAAPVIAQQKAPIPEPRIQETARKTAAEIYRDTYQQARTAEDKTALAKEMCETALQMPDGSADQYVLLRIARDIAAGAGDATASLSAVEKLIERFEIPSAKIRAETLLMTSKAATIAQYTAIAEAAMVVVEDAANAGEYEIALTLCDATRSLAEKAQELSLANDLLAKLDVLKAEQLEFQKYLAATVRLQLDPLEPVSNLIAGRYLCFIKGDWQRGIPMLALSEDVALKYAAVQEQQAGNAPDALLSLGDVWWGVAEKESSMATEQILQRAAAWYEKAIPNLTGLAKLKAEKRGADVRHRGAMANATVLEAPHERDRQGRSGLHGRLEAAKKELLVAHGGTATTEAAVKLGLDWLVKQQDARTGVWSLTGPYSNGGGNENVVAATAMALLALQGIGNTHKFGKFHPNVRSGADALLRMQRQDGNMFNEGSFNHRLYSQAQATIVLCELYGMTKDPRYRQPAQKALDYACQNQSPQGGWRYVPREDSDTSVTGWFVMALQTGLMAGLEVPTSTLEGIYKYLDTATSDGSFYSYQARAEPTLTMTAEALLCRQYLGWAHDDRRLRIGVDILLEDLIDYNEQDLYCWYYATQVLHHMGGKDWDTWNKVMRQAIPANQVKEGQERGSWAPDNDRWGHHGGRLYTTCLSCLMLEVYYRHLRIYKPDLPVPPARAH